MTTLATTQIETTTTPTIAQAEAAAAISEDWNSVTDQLLLWLSPNSIEDDEVPFPSSQLVKSAMDLCHDFSMIGVSAPMSVAATSEGTVEFEWRTGPHTHLIEVLGIGEAELTTITGDGSVSISELRRDPITRGWTDSD